MTGDPNYVTWVRRYVKSGRVLRVFYNAGNINNGLVHVRAIVDGDQVVVREWNRRKRDWYYVVRDITWFHLLRMKGVLSSGGVS